MVSGDDRVGASKVQDQGRLALGSLEARTTVLYIIFNTRAQVFDQRRSLEQVIRLSITTTFREPDFQVVLNEMHYRRPVTRERKSNAMIYI